MEQWDAYDRLPSIIRAALQESVVDWCSAWMFAEFRRFARSFPREQAIERTLTVLDVGEANEMARFARKSEIALHLNAGVSIQRYGAC